MCIFSIAFLHLQDIKPDALPMAGESSSWSARPSGKLFNLENLPERSIERDYVLIDKNYIEINTFADSKFNSCVFVSLALIDIGRFETGSTGIPAFRYSIAACESRAKFSCRRVTSREFIEQCKWAHFNSWI